VSEPDLAQRLERNLGRVRQSISDACQRAGRDPRSVCLLAVTKYVGPPVLQALLAAGLTEFGENRVQQLVARAEQLGCRPEGWPEPPRLANQAAPTAPRWHMIGHLQRNKVKTLLPYARILHSLDSERLAAEVQAVAERLNAGVDAFIEVNLAGEASKTGVPPEQLEGLAAAVRPHARIRWRGLMTMTPLDPDPEHARPYFARLRRLLEGLRGRGAVSDECVHLSMGMSQDYAVAVEEGATFVRIGSALFDSLAEHDADSHSGPP
jgi:pyridoxal phosphate enzyme (YggS family)